MTVGEALLLPLVHRLGKSRHYQIPRILIIAFNLVHVAVLLPKRLPNLTSSRLDAKFVKKG